MEKQLERSFVGWRWVVVDGGPLMLKVGEPMMIRFLPNGAFKIVGMGTPCGQPKERPVCELEADIPIVIQAKAKEARGCR